MDRYRWETVSTFSGHPVVMAAVCANVEWVIEEDVPAQARRLGAHLGRRLEELRDEHPCVAEVAGAGLLWAVELVRPDGSGARFVPDDRHASPAGPGWVLARRSSSRASAPSAASRSRPRRRTPSASACR